MPTSDQRTAEFESQRKRLVHLGYRMLGSIGEAEDVVQDAWLRWSEVTDCVDSPAAYLTRVVTRLCLDQLKSARVRRETYLGTWLPEPLISAADEVEETSDEVTFTLMLAMERLSPLERAAFLLHDIFDVALAEIAVALDRQPAAVRQLASRARKHLRESGPRYRIEAAEAERIADAFFFAARDGDVTRLSEILAHDVEIQADGGGKVIAFPVVIRGLHRALRLFASQSRKNGARPTLLRSALIDGLPGCISVDGNGVLQTMILGMRGAKIGTIYIVRNPEKLSHVSAASLKGQSAR
ncbi:MULTISPECIES: RNA polymerase sigma factor SigJ [Hydrocarboniphaga]|jgi:RNA polymerase sigma factor (sigma-70 family)|uniref:RNA polymerase sigma factor n=1 Tax=Hydrocarboniphaga effusa AP103 TaxID=1172194 RepID=I7ZG89_9GAMM|nr:MULTISPECIES: RNA polymerase sigma factor SigJ [Hydrocarboniphaga]EIT70732.1 RNA polymerase sigma factor [Hydrocarboniphaga effusa AP103]MDZ4079892.1 RNA polymerase sigma factor SigJ [Hydrocarboniphaga sp.]